MKINLLTRDEAILEVGLNAVHRADIDEPRLVRITQYNQLEYIGYVDCKDLEGESRVLAAYYLRDNDDAAPEWGDDQDPWEIDGYTVD
jgi:hypothetical protein